MTLVAQHGYGKAAKIHRGLEDRVIGGVVLSPRDETPAKLAAFATEVRELDEEALILFDPQVYACTVNPARLGKLEQYEYFTAYQTIRNFTPSEITRYAQACIDHQLDLPVSNIVAPTIFVADLRDRWGQIAINLMQESITYHDSLDDPPPLLLSLLVSDDALRSRSAVDDLLDEITTMECAGFYLVVHRSEGSYTQGMTPDALAHYLYLTHSLATLNNYTVIAGYTDLLGYLLHAVGATATACGWYNGLRQFSFARFEPSSGGSPPNPRYTSGPLLNSIQVNPELQACATVGRLNRVLTATPYDRVLSPAPSPDVWPLPVSTMHHWATVSGLIEALPAGSVGAQLDSVSLRLASATALYADLIRRRVVFSSASGPNHIGQWAEAITSFRTIARV